MRFLCRDCLTDTSSNDHVARCPGCGSPRVLTHPERDRLAIAHVDCDAFYAAVEKRENPTLADKPVIVGGGKRGVVSTCCYIARTFGVRSAMPMFKALKACPEAVVIKPRMELYSAVGREIKARMLELTPLVESVSIDEAFLDLSGTERLHGASPAVTLARFARRIESDMRLTVSVGLAQNKFLAKIASDQEKPRGFTIIGTDEALDFLAPRPVGLIWGVGHAMQDRLARDGIRVIADLRRVGEADLYRRYGSEGGRLFRLSRGIDSRRVTPSHPIKSVSNETTFNDDLSTEVDLAPILWRLCEKVAARLRHSGVCGASITVKLKTADFRLVTRARSGLPPTALAVRIHDVARDLLRHELTGVRYRLLGVGVSDLRPLDEADQGDLVDTDVKREVAAARAIEALRAKFGRTAVVRGIGMGADRPKPKGKS
ncbi:MAG TPA: DNA polymerase IV [Beijerinckiaceae bacterium]|nr:DNA polymerase IV [Beijerinckiaceae bacterium]